MYISVVLKGGNEELVRKDELQRLIAEQQVLFLKRADGWAVIGRDKMRRHGHEGHPVGNDRRNNGVQKTIEL